MAVYLWEGIRTDVIDIRKQLGIHVGSQPDVLISCFQGLMTRYSERIGSE